MITSADLQSGCCAAASSALTSKRAAVAAATKARLVGVKFRVRVGVRVKGGVGVGVRVTRAGARSGVRVGEIRARRTSSWGCAGLRQR